MGRPDFSFSARLMDTLWMTDSPPPLYRDTVSMGIKTPHSHAGHPNVIPINAEPVRPGVVFHLADMLLQIKRI